MPKTSAKQGNHTGKLTDEADYRRVCLARSAKLAKSPEVPPVVTPEAALYAHASTSSSKRTSTPTYLGVPLPYPWRERAKPLEGRVAGAHFGCCVLLWYDWFFSHGHTNSQMLAFPLQKKGRTYNPVYNLGA
jgi:hypothetical protein